MFEAHKDPEKLLEVFLPSSVVRLPPEGAESLRASTKCHHTGRAAILHSREPTAEEACISVGLPLWPGVALRLSCFSTEQMLLLQRLSSSDDQSQGDSVFV